jgi:hypothetical protein
VSAPAPPPPAPAPSHWLRLDRVEIISINDRQFRRNLRPWPIDRRHGHCLGWSRRCASSRYHNKTKGKFQETASFHGVHDNLPSRRSQPNDGDAPRHPISRSGRKMFHKILREGSQRGPRLASLRETGWPTVISCAKVSALS